VYRNDATRAANADGQRPESAETICTRWVSVLPRQSAERYVARQLKSDITHVVRMRRDSVTKDITGKYWLVLTDGTRLNIVGAYDVDNRHMEMELDCIQRA
jgi:SPP1 family predicted phage head-tail adaptor